ncbi:MAG: CinA family nicotinamide mononucleotide deamidase-related protein [Candidatus Flexifilum sp.]
MTTKQVRAEIIAIGTEILLGEITDTNSVFIARLLRDLGIDLYFMTSVGDNEQRIAEAVRIALSRAEVVITCGGLGPTVDDMTRQGVAAATGRNLVFHQALLDRIAQRFANFGVAMTENNRRQAYVPEGALIVENPVGTAPAFIVEVGQQCTISLPGVPREMKYLLEERVVPYLRERYDLRDTVIKTRILRTAGIGESLLDERIGKELLEGANPTVGLAAHSGHVDVRITAKAPTQAEADRMIAVVEAQLRERIGDYIFGTDAETLEQALIAVMRTHGASLAVSETGTGQLISARLRGVPNGESIIGAAYEFPSIEALAEHLRVPPTTPLRELTEIAARDAATEAGVSVGIALVSKTRDAADHADSQEFSAVAVFVDDKLRSRAYGFGGGSDFARQWGSSWAMSMAWRLIKERETSNASDLR